MIIALDTNILLDLFYSDAQHGASSATAVRECLSLGELVVCEVVWAELSSLFASRVDCEARLIELGVRYSPMNTDSASKAGEYWRQYCRRASRRTRVIADFLIGAHAQMQCDGLLTRDEGFYRDYFRALNVITPRP